MDESWKLDLILAFFNSTQPRDFSPPSAFIHTKTLAYGDTVLSSGPSASYLQAEIFIPGSEGVTMSIRSLSCFCVPHDPWLCHSSRQIDGKLNGPSGCHHQTLCRNSRFQHLDDCEQSSFRRGSQPVKAQVVSYHSLGSWQPVGKTDVREMRTGSKSSWELWRRRMRVRAVVVQGVDTFFRVFRRIHTRSSLSPSAALQDGKHPSRTRNTPQDGNVNTHYPLSASPKS